MTDTPPHPIVTGFAAIMTYLRDSVAAACGRPAPAGPLVLLARRPLIPPLALRLHQRLGKMMQEFAALVAHLVAFGADAPSRAPRGEPAPRPEAAAAPTPDAPPDATQDPGLNPPWGTPAAAQPESPPRAPRPPRLPSNFGWLPCMSSAAAAAASQLQYLLSNPDALALLLASPQLVRMIRPLCWMLGIKLPAAVVPPPPPKPEPDPDAPPKPPRRRRPRLWRPPSRRSDMLLLLRMGTKLIDP